MQVSQSRPNYHALDEAVEKHAGIRTMFVILLLLIVGIVHIARWALTSPVIGG